MNTRWINGVEYELDTDYPDFDVWIPVPVLDINSSGTTTVITSGGVKVQGGLLIEMLGESNTRNTKIHQMSEGDTPNTVLVAGLPLGAVQNMIGDWVCTTEILDHTRAPLTGPRSITETLDNSDGIESFKAEMLISEAALMVNEFTRNRPAKYYWLITVENPSIEYRNTLEIEIAVRRR